MDWIIQYWVQVGFALLCALVGYLWAIIKKLIEELRADREGTKALLKDRIEQSCRQYTAQGQVSPAEYDSVVSLYNAYVTLGNGSASTKILIENLAGTVKEDKK